MGRRRVNKNEPNKRLYKHWDEVFREIPGFEDCICLRRVRCPTGVKDMDFFLLSQKPTPKIGLVECEGQSHKVPVGVEQLLTYLAAFSQHAGDGRRTLKVSIRDAFDENKLRGVLNVHQQGSLEKWYKMGKPSIRSEEQLSRILAKASKHLVPILLYYRNDALTRPEYRLLRLAFSKHRLYAGTVQPTRPRLLEGKYLRLCA